MVKSSPLRQVYFLPSGRLRVEARYEIVREPLEQLLVEQHALDEEEVRGHGAASRWQHRCGIKCGIADRSVMVVVLI